MHSVTSLPQRLGETADAERKPVHVMEQQHLSHFTPSAYGHRNLALHASPTAAEDPHQPAAGFSGYLTGTHYPAPIGHHAM